MSIRENHLESKYGRKEKLQTSKFSASVPNSRKTSGSALSSSTLAGSTLAIPPLENFAIAGSKVTNLAKLGLALLLVFNMPAPPASSQVNAGYQPPNAIQGKTLLIPRGTIFEARMDSSIGSRQSRQGERFTISLASPVLANGTDVLIPAGAQILGEVVEAIAAGSMKGDKGGPKPTGKLRVQLSGLRMPDGVTYPLVASLAGDTFVSGGGIGRGNPNTRINTGVAYVGSQSNFDAVSPANTIRRTRGGPAVITRDQMMKDPLMGAERDDQNAGQAPKIRSLVKHGRDLVIMGGSPVSVRVDAPFKIGLSQAPGTASTLAPQIPIGPDGSFGRRFNPTGSSEPQAQRQSENPLPGILPDIPHSQGASGSGYQPDANGQNSYQAPAGQSFTGSPEQNAYQPPVNSQRSSGAPHAVPISQPATSDF